MIKWRSFWAQFHTWLIHVHYTPWPDAQLTERKQQQPNSFSVQREKKLSMKPSREYVWSRLCKVLECMCTPYWPISSLNANSSNFQCILDIDGCGVPISINKSIATVFMKHTVCVVAVKKRVESVYYTYLKVERHIFKTVSTKKNNNNNM